MTPHPEVEAVLADRLESDLDSCAEPALRYVRWHPKHGYRWADTHDEAYEETCGWISVPLYAHATPAVQNLASVATDDMCYAGLSAMARISFTTDKLCRLRAAWAAMYAVATEPSAVPVESLEHCPKCRFTMSGVGRCVNCESPASVPDGEGRQEFEQWANKTRGASIVRWDDSGEYVSHLTRDWWRCWAASRSSIFAATPPTNQEGAAP